MKDFYDVLEQNRKWAKKIKKKKPEFFSSLSTGQSPQYMWIGCSDSRVAAETITGLKPGEIFVHRNVANLIHADDKSAQAAIKFAIQGLNIREFIICGHYDCGGIRAADRQVNQSPDLKEGCPINEWLKPMYRKIEKYNDRVKGLEYEERIKVFCEFNVVKQVDNFKNLNVVQEALEEGKNLKIYGLIFDISKGKLREIESIHLTNQ